MQGDDTHISISGVPQRERGCSELLVALEGIGTMRRYTSIAGLSEARRLPRIGKLRLGHKVLSKGGKEIPRELDYFLLPEPGPDDPVSVHEAFARFREIYGEKPRELDVVIPSDDVGVFFPQRYKCYGSSGLRCVGDGNTAERIGSALGKQGEEASEFFELPCPTPEECEFAAAHGCKPVGSLFVILPRVTLGGCFQVDVSGINSILNINSAVEHVRTLCGRVAGLIFRQGAEIKPALALKRIPTKTQGGGHAAVHYPITLELRMSIDELRELMGDRVPELPAPAHERLPFDPDDEPLPGDPDREEERAQEGKPEIEGDDSKGIWDRIETGFEILKIAPELRRAYVKSYEEKPEELLGHLVKKAEKRGLRV